MTQSNDSNLYGLEIFWNYSTNEIPHDWTKLGAKLNLTITAKDSVDIGDIINTPEREPIHAPIPEQQPAENEDATQH